MALNTSLFTALILASIAVVALQHGRKEEPRRRGPEVPEFLKNLTKEEVQEFLEIGRNKSLSIDEIQLAEEALAEELGVAEEYNAFEAELEAKKNATLEHSKEKRHGHRHEEVKPKRGSSTVQPSTTSAQ